LGHTSQGHREIVGHDGLISSCGEDQGRVDLHKLSGVALPSYFSGKWDQNLRGQTTMSRCEASAIQPPPDPAGGIGVRAACLTGAVSTASKSPSRL
jgi:hypothetical protein